MKANRLPNQRLLQATENRSDGDTAAECCRDCRRGVEELTRKMTVTGAKFSVNEESLPSSLLRGSGGRAREALTPTTHAAKQKGPGDRIRLRSWSLSYVMGFC